jgi:hypothetical protein
MTTAEDGGKFVSLTHRPPLPPGNVPGTHFCQRLSRPQCHSATGRIMSMKNANDSIWNRNRDLPICSSVLSPLCHQLSPLCHRGPPTLFQWNTKTYNLKLTHSSFSTQRMSNITSQSFVFQKCFNSHSHNQLTLTKHVIYVNLYLPLTKIMIHFYLMRNNQHMLRQICRFITL